MPSTGIANISAKSFAELLHGPLLQICVGSEGRLFSIHSKLLAYHSHFFDEYTTTNGEEKCVRDSTVILADEDADAFNLFVKWIYQGKIDDVSDLPKTEKWNHAHTCQKLYMLCERLGMPELKNLAIDQFRKGCHEAGLVPGPEEMQPVYERTAPSSPFRTLVSKIAARQIMDPDTDQSADTYKACFESSPQFAVDVINAIKGSTGVSLFDDPTEGNPCRYHEHADGEKCRRSVKFADQVG